MIFLIISQKKLAAAALGNWWQAKVPHPLGLLDVVGFDETLVGVGFGRQTTSLQCFLDKQKITYTPRSMTVEELMTFQKIGLVGTPFQAAVWQALLEIPLNTCQTYSDIAWRINRSTALRAVGTAIGANPISILIPCHRVVPKSGGMGNYYWGPEIKAALLDLEKSSFV